MTMPLGRETGTPVWNNGYVYQDGLGAVGDWWLWVEVAYLGEPGSFIVERGSGIRVYVVVPRH